MLPGVTPMSSSGSDFPRDQDVSECLRAVRRESDLTQRALAELLNRSQTWVYHRENARRRVELVDFVAWCRACGVEPLRVLMRLLDDGCQTMAIEAVELADVTPAAADAPPPPPPPPPLAA